MIMCMYVYTSVCVCVQGFIHVHLCVRVAIYVWLYITAMQTCSFAPNPVTEDPDPIWIYDRYEPDTPAI